MGASRKCNPDHKGPSLNLERESGIIKIMTAASEGACDANSYLDYILTTISSDEIADCNSSELDLGLGIESEDRQTSIENWEFDSRRINF